LLTRKCAYFFRVFPCIFSVRLLTPMLPYLITARAPAPLWSPNDYPWMAGNTAPGTLCNVPQVAFLEAAHAVTDQPDAFRVYYGGSDAVVGTAVVTFDKTETVCGE
jgi:predicted GH43/DUF377 family glycosyl hydrolase